MRRKQLLRGVAGGAVAIAISAGVATAVWSASGSGTGTGGAKVAQGLTVSGISQINGSGAALYPGGPAGWVYITVTNPNPYAVTITGLSWGTPTSNNTTACPSSNISLDANAPTTTSIPIPANATAGATYYSINNVLDLSHSAPDGCQGVLFNAPVTVTGTQQ